MNHTLRLIISRKLLTDSTSLVNDQQSNSQSPENWVIHLLAYQNPFLCQPAPWTALDWSPLLMGWWLSCCNYAVFLHKAAVTSSRLYNIKDPYHHCPGQLMWRPGPHSGLGACLTWQPRLRIDGFSEPLNHQTSSPRMQYLQNTFGGTSGSEMLTLSSPDWWLKAAHLGSCELTPKGKFQSSMLKLKTVESQLNYVAQQ